MVPISKRAGKNILLIVLKINHKTLVDDEIDVDVTDYDIKHLVLNITVALEVTVSNDNE